MSSCRTVLLLLLCTLLSQGCTSYHECAFDRFESPGECLEEINRRGVTKKAYVHENDGPRYTASGLFARPDSLFWYAADDSLPFRRPLPDMNRVIFIDRGRGAGDAFLAGFIPVALFAGVMAIIESGRSDDPCSGQEICLDPDADFYIGAGLVAGVVSGLLAAPVGYLVGHEDVYLLPGTGASAKGAARGWRVTGGFTEAKQVWDGRWPTSWLDSRDMEWTTGFQLGVHTEWFGTRNLSFSTGLSYEEKGFGYYHEDAGAAVDYRFSYLSLPVLLRYRAEMRLWSPFFFAGPRADYLVSRPDDPWGMSSSFKDLIYGLSLGGGYSSGPMTG